MPFEMHQEGRHTVLHDFLGALRWHLRAYFGVSASELTRKRKSSHGHSDSHTVSFRLQLVFRFLRIIGNFLLNNGAEIGE